MLPGSVVTVFLTVPLIIMIFPSITYWSAFSKDRKTEKNPNRADYQQPYYGLLIIGVLLMWVLWLGGIVLYLFDKTAFLTQPLLMRKSLPVILQIVGLVFFTLGSMTYNACIIFAGRNLRPAPSGALSDHQLIEKGPFAIVRHPLYLSYILISIGLSLILLNLWTLSAPLCIIAGIYPTAKAEETVLTSKFGKEYIDYKKRVGMFFPRLFHLRTSTGGRYD